MSVADGGVPERPGDNGSAPLPASDLEAATLTADAVATALLGCPRELSRRDVATVADVRFRNARRFWHALGLPLADTDDPLFTRADVQALHRMDQLVKQGRLDADVALALTRAFARTTDRLAAWQVQLFAEAAEPGSREGDVPPSLPSLPAAQSAAATLLDLADELEPLLVYAWRRHLAAAAARLITDAAPGDEVAAGGRRCVGFADLVSFTAIVRRLSERELAATVQRFESLASDVVTAHGGRVVKTVGDEVLFVTGSPAPGAAIALDLVDALAEDPVLPELRVGLAYGPVVSRLGDVFGTTVNRAARLTGVAKPGLVLVDSALALALETVSGFDVRVRRPRTLRGVGFVTPYLLTRATSTTRRRRI